MLNVKGRSRVSDYYIASNIKRYRHSEISPMAFYILPSILLHRDPKAQNRQRPPLMIFISVFVWELRIELRL